MIYAVSTVLNEADIVGDTIAHLLGEGVDHVLVYDGMSTDGTREILARFDQVTIFDDTAGFHRQPELVTELTHRAGEAGATWILPVDADEFWSTTSGLTISELLETMPDDVGRLPAVMFQHIDHRFREPDPKPLPKMAFRYHRSVQVTNGNHDAVNVPGYRWDGHLQIREIQYRGFEHFCRKILERNRTIDPSLAPTEGEHHKRYAGWTAEQLRPVWDRMQAQATTEDPIPCRR